MKTSMLFSALAIGAMAVGMASCESHPKASLKTSVDSVSYAIGLNTGIGYKENLAQFPGEDKPNIDDMIAGFVAGLHGDTTMSREQAMTVIQTYFQNAEKAESAKAIAEGEAFLAENKTKEGVITTESGLQYKVEKMGEGEKPTADSKVTVHYTGKLLDGTVFDSSVERGEPTTFGVGQVIKGWTEGLQLMPVGSKFTFYIPSELAYGERAAGQLIKPNSTLVFDVELIEVEK